MSICIFAGPSLPPRKRPAHGEIVWLPPARHGDVHRAVELLQPSAIGIIDGYFRWAPSVRHQEILWALDRGVPVFGAASMGALRAAELAPFGMRGVGQIFRAYCTGVLDAAPDVQFEDEDEVAVTHGPAAAGYAAASEAMVNVRCTLRDAETARVVCAATRLRLVDMAKAMHFPERTYEHLMRLARDEGLPESELAALETWLPEGRVDQKMADALALVEVLAGLAKNGNELFRADFKFERTTLWYKAFESAHVQPHDDEERAVLQEARLNGSWALLSAEAIDLLAPVAAERGCAARLAERLSGSDGETADPVLEQAQRARTLERLRGAVPLALIERKVLDSLRASGRYAEAAVRARDKTSRLAARADLPHVDDLPGHKLLALQMWFFERHGADLPDDMGAYLRASGYRDESELNASLLHEYLYLQTRDGHGTTGRQS